MMLTDYMSQEKKEKDIEDSVDASIQWLEDYLQKCEERMITVTRKNTANMGTNRAQINWK